MTPTISTQRLILRSITHNDVKDLIEVVSHPSVARITTAIGTSVSEIRRHIDRQGSYKPFEKGKYYDLAVERKEAHLRQAEFRDGKWIDILIYAILAAEWKV